jgi:phosphosulfolactate phosphohydrolase-like enzyme
VKLPSAAPQYDLRDQAQLRNLIERADVQNRKQGQDVEIRGARLVLTSPNGTRYSVTVDNSGNLSTTAL